MLNEDCLLYLINNNFELAYKLQHPIATKLRQRNPVKIKVDYIDKTLLIEYIDGWRVNGLLYKDITTLQYPFQPKKIEFICKTHLVSIQCGLDWIKEIIELYILYNGQLLEIEPSMAVVCGSYQLILHNSIVMLCINNRVIIEDVERSTFMKRLQMRSNFKLTANNKLVAIYTEYKEAIQQLHQYTLVHHSPMHYIRLNNYYSLYFDIQSSVWHFKRDGDMYWIQATSTSVHTSNSIPSIVAKHLRYISCIQHVVGHESVDIPVDGKNLIQITQQYRHSIALLIK